MTRGTTPRIVAGTAALVLVGGLLGGAVAAQSDAGWTLDYRKKANRFVASAADDSMCARYGEDAKVTDDGVGCWYAPGELSFLETLGFEGDVSGFSVTDPAGDVFVFAEGRPAPDQRYDATGIEWATIDADSDLLQAAADTPGAIVGDGFDTTPGPRVALFAHLSEPAVADGDVLSLNINTYLDTDITNDMVRPVDPSRPNGGGDLNIALGWVYRDGDTERQATVGVWSEAAQSVMPSDIVAGPSEDPPGVWAIIGPEHLGDRFNSMVISSPTSSPTLIDGIEGASGPFGSFELDGNTQAYFTGFTMDGTANIPGKDFQLVFETPYAPLFEGGTARIGYLADTSEDFFEQGFETTDSTISMGLSLPTGATGLSSIELQPLKKTKVAVDNQKKPVTVRQWLKGDQLAEINDALAEILALSMSSRIELADGQEVHIGAGGG